MKKHRPIYAQRKSKRFNGIFGYPQEETEIDPSIVSATEMTGLLPAVRDDEYSEEDFEEYFM